MKTYKVIISGKVQRVFFRDHIMKKAISSGINGYVKNTNEGNVEAIFQCSEKNIKKMIEWCKIGPTNSRVDSVEFQEIKSFKEYKDFNIIY